MAKPSETTTTLARPKPDTNAIREKPKDLTYDQISTELFNAGDIVPMSEFGTGFSLLDSKEKGRLVGVPFIILDYRVNEGDFGPFVSAQIVTNGNEKLVLNDGSSGIGKQLSEIAEAGETRAIFVKKGLRRSDFEYTDPKTGEKKPATTFYLDTSA